MYVKDYSYILHSVLSAESKIKEVSYYRASITKDRAKKRKGHTSLMKKNQNLNSAVRNFGRLLNCNFNKTDYSIALTYEPETLPENAETAFKDVQLFIRRLKRAIKNAGAELVAVWVTADKNTNTGAPVRLHHHILLKKSKAIIAQKVKSKDGVSYEVFINGRNLSEIWGKGIVKARPIGQSEYFDKAGVDLTGVANYLLRQAADVPNKPKWHCTRDLKKPVVLQEKISDHRPTLDIPEGAIILEQSRYYIRYIMPEHSKHASSMRTNRAAKMINKARKHNKRKRK